MPRKSMLSVIIFIFALTFCCSSKIEISGELFIVTNNAQNIKLGLVAVLLIPEKDITEFVAKKKEFLATELPKLKEHLEDSKKKLEVAEQISKEASSTYMYSEMQDSAQAREAIEKKYPKVKINNIDDLNKDRIASEKALEELKSLSTNPPESQHTKDLRSKYYQLSGDFVFLSGEVDKEKQLVASFPQPEDILKDFPVNKVIVKATSDSDGKFSITIPAKGKYALLARASRQLLDKTEKYDWFLYVSFEDNNSPKNIMLSNNNLISSDDPNVIIKANLPPTK